VGDILSYSEESPALVGARPDADPSRQVVTMGHAGSGAAQFVGWQARFEPGVWLRAVRMPGREARLLEQPHETVGAMVAELCAPLVTGARVPTVLYGHCLGALVMYELAHALSDRGFPLQAIVVSAQGAPDGPRPEALASELPSSAFWEIVRDQGGLPDAVLASTEMRELIEPALRADWLAADSYAFNARSKLDIPITAVWGTRDRLVRREAMCGWQLHSHADFRLREIEGDHFLLAPQTLDDVGSIVAAVTSTSGVGATVAFTSRTADSSSSTCNDDPGNRVA
jgi:medium-chain acyl-[acyl-carrier-protein] hydrolase